MTTIKSSGDAMNLADNRSRSAPDDGEPKAPPDRFNYHI